VPKWQWTKMMAEWTRPFRKADGVFKPLSSEGHLSCWDCEHIRVAGMPNRKCAIHSDIHIWSPGPMEIEVFEEEDSGRKGSVADRCNDFQVASEFDGSLFPIHEQELQKETV